MLIIKELEKYFAAHYFYQVKNGKFIVAEGAFIFMLIACIILTYGMIYHDGGLRIIPFCIPFCIVAYKIMFSGFSKIEQYAPHWRTQLDALTDPKSGHLFNSDSDLILEEELEGRWIEEYGECFEQMSFVKIQKWLPLSLPIICGLVILMYA